MTRRNTLPTFTVREGAPEHILEAVEHFSDIVSEDPDFAARTLSGFVDCSDLLAALGRQRENDTTKRGRLIAVASALVANEYEVYVEPDAVTQVAIDDTVAVMQQAELAPFVSDDIGVVALRVFASQMRNYHPV